MDVSQAHSTVLVWLQHYGSFALFGMLVLGIIMFPFPQETLIMAAGVFVKTGHMSAAPTLLACYAGSICGVSLSYFIGRQTDKFFIKKYGSWAGLNPSTWKELHGYFEQYGTWMLFFGYFIPGVRHFTGFLVGVTRLEWSRFALFAYSGALLWTSTFLSIGYFLGDQWAKAIAAEKYVFVDSLVTVALFYCLYTIFRKFLQK